MNLSWLDLQEEGEYETLVVCVCVDSQTLRDARVGGRSDVCVLRTVYTKSMCICQHTSRSLYVYMCRYEREVEI